MNRALIHNRTVDFVVLVDDLGLVLIAFCLGSVLLNEILGGSLRFVAILSPGGIQIVNHLVVLISVVKTQLRFGVPRELFFVFFLQFLPPLIA